MTDTVLGVGMVHAPGLESLLEAGSDLIDVIEIEPQLRRDGDGRYRLDEKLFAAAERFSQPKLIHGVGFPVGGTQPCHPRDLEPLAEAVRRTAAPWASEHLSFNQVRLGGREFFSGFLLPPVQTPQMARIAAENIRAAQDALPVPFAFETGVNYLAPQPGEMRDGAFFAAVAEQSDCGILLDLHNLWCNERNGRQRVLDVLAELPLDRIWEVHLAGGKEQDGLWLDAHSDTPPAPLYEIAERVLPELPNLGALIFEISPDVLALGQVTAEQVLEHLRRIRQLWDRASTAARPPAADRHVISAGRRAGSATGSPRGASAAEPVTDPAAWEAALGSLTVSVTGLAAAARTECGDDLVDRLAADRSVPVLRGLVKSFRDGVIAIAMPLTFRMIMFHGGEPAFHDLMHDFWLVNPPRRFQVEELGPILDYLRVRSEIPYLHEIAAYELAARRVRETGVAEKVRFTTEPIALLTDLAAYRLPAPAETGEFVLEVTP
jgi:uncharacterized protein (UPF0276 family)